MAPVLTPSDALEYLFQLSTDMRAGVVLATGLGRPPLLAGPETLAEPARALLGASRGSETAVALAGGIAFAARDDAHAIVIACGPHALGALVRHDLRTVLGDLADGPAEPLQAPPIALDSPSAGALEAAAAVLSAAGNGQNAPSPEAADPANSGNLRG